MRSIGIIISNAPRKPKLAEGIYDAVITNIAEANGIATTYGLKDKIIVTFKAGDIEINRRYNKSLHPSSSLYGLIKELNGGVLGNEYDVETLVGTACRVVVVHRATETNDIWENVDRVMKATRSEADLL